MLKSDNLLTSSMLLRSRIGLRVNSTSSLQQDRKPQKARIKCQGLKITGSSIMGGLRTPRLFLMVKRNAVKDADV